MYIFLPFSTLELSKRKEKRMWHSNSDQEIKLHFCLHKQCSSNFVLCFEIVHNESEFDAIAVFAVSKLRTAVEYYGMHSINMYCLYHFDSLNSLNAPETKYFRFANFEILIDNFIRSLCPTNYSFLVVFLFIYIVNWHSCRFNHTTNWNAFTCIEHKEFYILLRRTIDARTIIVTNWMQCERRSLY